MLVFAMYSRNVRMPASCTLSRTVQVVDGLDVLALGADEGSETGTPKRAVRLFSPVLFSRTTASYAPFCGAAR